MTIQEAIKKAIEGGFEYSYADKDPDLENSKWMYLSTPSFWQCLGKSMGWSECIKGGHEEGKNFCGNNHIPQWKVEWHELIDCLASGKSIEDYFNQL